MTGYWSFFKNSYVKGHQKYNSTCMEFCKLLQAYIYFSVKQTFWNYLWQTVTRLCCLWSKKSTGFKTSLSIHFEQGKFDNNRSLTKVTFNLEQEKLEEWLFFTSVICPFAHNWLVKFWFVFSNPNVSGTCTQQLQEGENIHWWSRRQHDALRARGCIHLNTIWKLHLKE